MITFVFSLWGQGLIKSGFMKEFWDERYDVHEFVYGTEPNRFIAEKLRELKTGFVLMPAEGEGRNAAFAAGAGWKVHAFDYSRVAFGKAMELARKMAVDFEYQIQDCENFQAVDSYYDAIAFSFLHLREYQRRTFHQKLVQSLKPGGVLIAELFSKKQINLDTGGPKSLEMLYSVDDLRKDFSGLKRFDAEEVRIDLKEGPFHNGEAWVIQVYGKK